MGLEWRSTHIPHNPRRLAEGPWLSPSVSSDFLRSQGPLGSAGLGLWVPKQRTFRQRRKPLLSMVGRDVPSPYHLCYLLAPSPALAPVTLPWQ